MDENKRNSRKSSGVVIAFATGPAVASATVASFFLVLGVLLGAHRDALIVPVGGLFGGMLILGYLVSVIFGIPVYLLFRRLGWIGRRHWFLLGAAIGALSGAIFVLVGLLNARSADPQVRNVVSAGVVVGFVLAGVMGLIFSWLIRPKVPTVDEVASTFD